MVETVPHPLDQDYNSLNCKLDLLDTDTETFKVVGHIIRLSEYKALVLL